MVPHPSLSVVLPVHNAEQVLAEKLAQLLDFLPDLTNNFEVLVVNDGSTDHTEEIAYELARVYPQVRVTRHERRRGPQGVVETGLSQTTGDILLIQDEHAAIDFSKLQRLWDLRNDRDLVFARPEFRVKQPMLQRLAAWGVRLEEAANGGVACGVQMIRRDSLPSLDEGEQTVSAMAAQRSRTTRPDSPQTNPPNSKYGGRDRLRPISRHS